MWFLQIDQAGLNAFKHLAVQITLHYYENKPRCGN